MIAAHVLDGESRERRRRAVPGLRIGVRLIEQLRECAIGPELVLDPSFDDVSGRVSIERNGQVLWSREVRTGEANMCHSLANMEHHHFKYDAHRRAGDVHIHFFGADAFSFGAGLALQDGDVMEVAFDGFGKALRNPVLLEQSEERLVEVRPA